MSKMGKKELVDQDILRAIRGGHDEQRALELLYRILLPKVKLICKRYKAKDVDAYDVFQESILKLYDYVKTSKFNESYSIESFVLVVAKNKVIDILRKVKNKREVELEDFKTPDDLVVSNDQLVTKEKSDIINQLFISIGEKCKELLLLSKYDRRSMTEISHIMGFKSENSAKTQTYKCKKKLIESLESNPSLAKEILRYD